MNCIWEPFEDEYKCKNCGFTVPRNTIKKTCSNFRSGTPKDIPSISQRMINFGKAGFKHIMTGGKHCTPEQKRERYEICTSNKCGLFKAYGTGGVCAHDDCGCFIRSNGKFLDKLSWADSKCPVDMWGPISTENDENGV